MTSGHLIKLSHSAQTVPCTCGTIWQMILKQLLHCIVLEMRHKVLTLDISTMLTGYLAKFDADAAVSQTVRMSIAKAQTHTQRILTKYSR